MAFFSGSVVKDPSLSCFADTETPIRWNECCPQAHNPRSVGTRRVMILTPNYFTTNQSEVCPRSDHALFETFL